jgi:2-oxoglutarate ferredoxin oxidoreductase subunit alpha
MMEPVEFAEGRQPIKELPPKTWATTGFTGDRRRSIVNSLFLDPEVLERHNLHLKEKYDTIARDELRYSSYGTDTDYEVLIVAYGTVARVCSTAMEELAEAGKRVAMVRPISLFPFPFDAVREAAARARAVLVVELSTGQMLEDVRMEIGRDAPIHFYSRTGGMLVTPDEVVEKVTGILEGEEANDG